MAFNNSVVEILCLMLNNIEWINEPIEDFPGNKGLYKLFCIMLCKRKLSYLNLYMLTYNLYKNKYKENENEFKEKIIQELTAIYYYNNKKMPWV